MGIGGIGEVGHEVHDLGQGLERAHHVDTRRVGGDLGNLDLLLVELRVRLRLVPMEGYKPSP